jgi:hypothetical protein
MERRTRRFVRDGEVPVVVLGRTRDATVPGAAPSNRLVAAETALQLEKAAREKAERSLHDAQETIQHLQTQLGHASLAHAEAMAAERHHREAVERSLTEALATCADLERRSSEHRAVAIPAPLPIPQAQQAAVLPVAPVVQSRKIVESAVEKTIAVTKPAAVARTPRAQKTQTQKQKAQPVKWWLSNAKTANKTGARKN